MLRFLLTRALVLIEEAVGTLPEPSASPRLIAASKLGEKPNVIRGKSAPAFGQIALAN
jgi:hypothetical protein